MKLDMPPGEAFMFRERSTSSKALSKIFGSQHKQLDKMVDAGTAFPEFPDTIKTHFDYGGEILKSYGAKSAPFETYGFPGYTCISVNNEAAHGIPSENKILIGHIVIAF